MIKELRGKNSVLPVSAETTRDEIKAFVRAELGNKIHYIYCCNGDDKHLRTDFLVHGYRYENDVMICDDTAIIETHTDFIMAEIKMSMARFETGKTYTVKGIGDIIIQKRTKCYATVSGAYNGRLLIRQWIKDGEVLLVPAKRGFTVFCFSWDKNEIKKIICGEMEA